MTKVFSAAPNGRIRRYKNKPSTDERIMQLNRLLNADMTPKDARKELRYLEFKIQNRFISSPTN
jgi:hypothetical protein